MLYPVIGVSVYTVGVRLASLLSPGLRGLLGAPHRWPQGTGSWRSESMCYRCCTIPVQMTVGENLLPPFSRYPGKVVARPLPRGWDLAGFQFLGGRSRLEEG